MSLTYHIDRKALVYCIANGRETRVLDFSTVREEANAIAGMLGKVDLLISPSEDGTMNALAKYRRLKLLCSREGRRSLWFDPRVKQSVRHALLTATATRRPIRLIYGDPASGRAYLEHAGVHGWIAAGQDDGVMRPTLSETQNLETSCAVHELDIVRVIDTSSTLDTYVHPEFHMPDMEVVERSERGFELHVDGSPMLVAEHKVTLTKWARFFAGSSHDSPQVVPVFHPESAVIEKWAWSLTTGPIVPTARPKPMASPLRVC
ncbi:MAG: hypothetical protein PSV26_02740 [Polaromonas sp.]|uniref:hypothetical protein n=1 Tax=Polaromonas sp. TaxID=1869339 RepID=UPI002487BCF9|nr:hypothetical protein [Polaromonas sp.]MDI1236384.1 hypothetical protein [Polaromonas sp.]